MLNSVLQASPCYAPAYRLGGPVRSLEGLVGALRARGVRVTVITTNGHGPERLDVPPGWSEWQGVPALYLPRWLAPDVTPRMFTEVLRAARKADAVHVTGLFCVPTVLALAAARVARKPAVLSPRGALETGSLRAGNVAAKRTWLRAFRPLFRTAALFHATSEKEAASVRSVFGDDVAVSVVPNGTDVEAAVLPEPANTNGAAAATDARPVIGALGRIHPSKGYDRLISAVALLAQRGVDVELAIAGPRGDSEYAAELEAQASRLGIASRVRLIGEVYGADKARFYRSCRVFALPSHETENFGNVVIEALAQGTPVVASRFTPWSELEEVGCGRWVANTGEELAAGLAPYLEDAAFAAGQGLAGRELIRSRYTWSAVGAHMVEAYEDAISRHAARLRAGALW